MDTCLWGPPMWRLVAECLRVSLLTRGDRDPALRRRLRQWALLLLLALRALLPCVYCRRSYRNYLEAMPPHLAPDLLAWWWQVKELVNAKLDRTACLPLGRFRRRCEIWTSMIDDCSLWDLLTMLALNYPRTVASDATGAADEEQQPEDDDDDEEKRRAYYLFWCAIEYFVAHIPTLASMAPYLASASLRREDLADRAAFFRTVSERKQRWAREQRGADVERAFRDSEHRLLELVASS